MSRDAKKRKAQQDILGLDLSSAGRKMVRLKKAKTGWSLVGGDFHAKPSEEGMGYPAIPKDLQAHHVSLAMSAPSSIIRLITLPSSTKSKNIGESQLREQVGIGDDYRLSFRELMTSNRKETRLLVVAVPNAEAQEVITEYNQPVPAPISLEVSGLAALNAFMEGKELNGEGEGDAIGFIESGASMNLVAFFCKGELVLLRKFDFGGDALVEKVQRHLGLDQEVAEGLVREGSFDLSEPVKDVVDPFFRQLSISKDFVERHQRVHLNKIYLSGGMSLSQYWVRELAQEMGVEVSVWNPFERLPITGNISPEIKSNGTLYTACVGASIGAMNEL